MTNAVLSSTLAAATVAVGLTAGFLATFAHTVMPALATADDEAFVKGFQDLDRAVANPWFMAPFTLAPLLAATAWVVALSRPGTGPTVLLGVACALAAATVVVTAAVHLPLNRDLGSVARTATAPELADARAAFEHRWVHWHDVRTIAATGSFACLVLALLRLP